VKLERKSFGMFPDLMKQYLPLGVTSFLSQASLVASMAAVQSSCAKWGALDPVFGQPGFTQIPLAVLGIVMKFFQIAISISVGLSAGCIPVVGYNIGAQRKDRVKTLFTYLLAAEAIVGFVALFIVEVFPRGLIGIFGAANESEYYTNFAIRCFRVYLCMMPLAMVNKGTFIFLQALGKAKESMILSLVREIIFGVFLPILLPLVFALNGVLYSFPVADVLTFILSAIVIARVYRELGQTRPQLA